MAKLTLKQQWNAEAERIVLEVATNNQEFTPDDIWRAGLSKPEEARALGPVMNRAKNLGLIKKSGRVQPTSQQESHGTDITIWLSLAYKPGV